MRRTDPRRFRPELTELEDLILPSFSNFVVPWQLSQAYSLANLTFTSGGQTVKANGAGQTIAIIDAYHDPYLQRDLQIYDSVFDLPSASLSQVDLAGSSTDDGWAGEEIMDVELVHSVAPAARIVVVEAASDGINDLINAINTAKSIPGVSVVSMSWGGSEWNSQTSLDGTFTTPSGHQGITFVAATGDGSAYAGASWPASSPNVVAVGGTSLFVNADGTYAGEVGWSGSGGGLSQVESEPSYQTSVQSTGTRTTPDVSVDADPNTGFLIFGTTPSNGQLTWQQVGGTSASTQIMGALIAIADQGRALAGKSTLDGASQTLPAIYSLPASDFHDITWGSNGYRALPGYDLVTGRGSPVGSAFIRDLVNYGGGSSVVASTTKAVSAGKVNASLSIEVGVSATAAVTPVTTAFVVVPLAPSTSAAPTAAVATASAPASTTTTATTVSVARSLPTVSVKIDGLDESPPLAGDGDQTGRTDDPYVLGLEELLDGGYPLWFLP